MTQPICPELTQGAFRPTPAAATARVARTAFPRNTLGWITEAATAEVLAKEDAARTGVTTAGRVVVAASHVDITPHHQTADGRIYPHPPGCGPVAALRAPPTQADAARATSAATAAAKAKADAARATTAAAAAATDKDAAARAAPATAAAATAASATAPARGSHICAPPSRGRGRHAAHLRRTRPLRLLSPVPDEGWADCAPTPAVAHSIFQRHSCASGGSAVPDPVARLSDHPALHHPALNNGSLSAPTENGHRDRAGQLLGLPAQCSRGCLQGDSDWRGRVDSDRSRRHAGHEAGPAQPQRLKSRNRFISKVGGAYILPICRI